MTFFNKTYSQVVATVLLVYWMIAGACSKEKVEAPYPYHELKTFKIVATTGDTIQAAVADGSIILYWPFDEPVPATITPLISVSDKATVSPASGTAIAIKDSVSYVVTAQTGATASYKLRVIVNQPDLQINDGIDMAGQLGANMSIGGITYLIPDVNISSAYLVSATGVETKCTINGFTELGANDYALEMATPDVDTGSYKLKVVSATKTVTSERAFVKVIYPLPSVVAPTTAITVKRGGTFTLNGTNMRGMLAGRARLTGGQTYYDLELAEFDLTSVTYRIPADFPLGNYNLLHAAFRNYQGVTVYMRAGTINPVLIITE
ncbi:hypothetical protein [Chitinophaga pinensis]|uniref:DUF5018 domain-containing protein n=1 Tax=Chitinophaga pinensis TaxID=79329 RepID=A0A5C6LU07_9BACT|nr:hypothetical protein [Chitinophaga pinensis]TWW00761.1 hypothetical protein FEF09_09685 [Chitinophaga pinensis]